MGWTYPRKIELEAIIWRDILIGNLLFHNDQVKRVDSIDEVTTKSFKLTFHDGSELIRKWDACDIHTTIFLRVKNRWNIINWSIQNRAE